MKRLAYYKGFLPLNSLLGATLPFLCRSVPIGPIRRSRQEGQFNFLLVYLARPTCSTQRNRFPGAPLHLVLLSFLSVGLPFLRRFFLPSVSPPRTVPAIPPPSRVRHPLPLLRPPPRNLLTAPGLYEDFVSRIRVLNLPNCRSPWKALVFVLPPHPSAGRDGLSPYSSPLFDF